MTFNTPTTVEAIANIIGCPFVGNDQIEVTGLNEIHVVKPGNIVFVDHPKYYKKALESLADVIIINKEVEFPEHKAIIISEHPFDDFNRLIKHFGTFEHWNTDRGLNTNIDETAVIYPNVTIGNFVEIGKNSVVLAGAVLSDYTIIKDNVIIGPNAVIGHSAFYYKKKPTGYDRLLSCGRTIIENNVEIGALATIDRGVTGDTIIGEGSKLDNQVHIGHDTVVGKHCLLAANVGVAGCVTIEDHVTLWGQVGVTSDVIIGEKAVVQAQSGVARSLKGGFTYFGSPAAEARSVLREMAALRKLPSIIENL